MSMQHTPGPWQAKSPRIGAAITIYGADGEFPVATTCSNTSPVTMQAHRDGTVIANSRLIAAAPELLDALRVLLALHDAGVFTADAWDSSMEDARSAIAKACGI